MADDLVGNPGTQAVLAAVTAAYPIAGVAIQAAQLVNNWLMGSKDMELGAKLLDRSEQEFRCLDHEVFETRHQQELLEIEHRVA